MLHNKIITEGEYNCLCSKVKEFIFEYYLRLKELRTHRGRKPQTYKGQKCRKEDCTNICKGKKAYCCNEHIPFKNYGKKTNNSN